MSTKLVIPEFTPHFEYVRNDKTKHLTLKKPDGSFMVEQDEIDNLARGLLMDPFYVEPWLTSCDIQTVLFPDVIDGLKGEDPAVRRKSVNLAYQTEDRLVKLGGVDEFVAWAQRGRDRNDFGVPKGNSKGFRKLPARKPMSLTKLTAVNREAIEKIYNNKNLLGEMPTDLSSRIKQAHDELEKGQLYDEFAELILAIFEQWRVYHKHINDLKVKIPDAIDQRDELLVDHANSAASMAHCSKLIGSITDPKKLTKLLKEGVEIQRKLTLPGV
jgi:hypothetical protein